MGLPEDSDGPDQENQGPEEEEIVLVNSLISEPTALQSICQSAAWEQVIRSVMDDPQITIHAIHRWLDPGRAQCRGMSP